MREEEYAFAVAYTKTIENKMLSQKDLDTLLRYETTAEAMKFLQDRGYGRGAAEPEEMLRAEIEKAWQVVYDACGEEVPVEILLYQNDFHNLKTILKAVMSNAQWENLVLRPSVAAPEEIYEAVVHAQFDDLPAFLREPAREAYALISTTNDGQLTEIFLDKALFAAMRSRAAAEHSQFLQRWVEMNIVIADLKTAVRGAFGRKTKAFLENAMIPSDTLNIQRLAAAAAESMEAVCDVIAQAYPDAAEALRKSFDTFEKWCDNYRMSMVREEKNKFFGFEPILAFLIGKQAEIQALRIILSGKENHVPAEIIEERLRDMYV